MVLLKWKRDKNRYSWGVSSNKKKLAIGFPNDSTDYSGQNYLVGAGAVYLYTKCGKGWTFETKITPIERVSLEGFGNAVKVEQMTPGVPLNRMKERLRVLSVQAKLLDKQMKSGKLDKEFYNSQRSRYEKQVKEIRSTIKSSKAEAYKITAGRKRNLPETT
jgi:hypothetical protein